MYQVLRTKDREKGQAMLLTVMLLTGVILSTTSLAALITLYQMRQATDVASSNQAIFAADAGIECALYKKFKEEKSNEDIAQECSQISFGNKAAVKSASATKLKSR